MPLSLINMSNQSRETIQPSNTIKQPLSMGRGSIPRLQPSSINIQPPGNIKSPSTIQPRRNIQSSANIKSPSTIQPRRNIQSSANIQPPRTIQPPSRTIQPPSRTIQPPSGTIQPPIRTIQQVSKGRVQSKQINNNGDFLLSEEKSEENKPLIPNVAETPIKSYDSNQGINLRPKQASRSSKSGIDQIQGYTPIVLEDNELDLAITLPRGDRKYKSAVVRNKLKLNQRISIFHKVISNVIAMLELRGYEIPINMRRAVRELTPLQFIEIYRRKVELFNFTYPDSDKTVRKALSGIFRHKTKGNYIYVYYPEKSDSSQSMGKDKADYIGIMSFLGTFKNNIKESIIVSDQNISKTGMNSLINEYRTIKFTFFHYDELTSLAVKHSMTAKHELMTIAEKEEEIFSSGTRMIDIPTIAKDDSVVKELGFNPGDVLRIRRENLISDQLTRVTIVYRRVVRKSVLPKNN